MLLIPDRHTCSIGTLLGGGGRGGGGGGGGMVGPLDPAYVGGPGACPWKILFTETDIF